MNNLEHFQVTEVEKNSLFEKRVYDIFITSISSQVSIEHFRKLFSKYVKMDLYIMKKDDKDIGMAYFMTCNNPENKKDIYIRLGLGIVEEERGNSNFPKMLIFKSMIRLKLKNLFKNVYMVAITMNPIAYSATCKYWKFTYPSPILEESDAIVEVKKRIVNRFGLKEVDKDVIRFPFVVTEIEKVKKKFSEEESGNTYINYFGSKIAAEDCDKGLLNIVPINFANVWVAATRKYKLDAARSLYRILDERVMPALSEYSPS